MIKAAYPEHIPISALPFLVTIGVISLTVAFTIALQFKRLAKESPTETLRSK